MLRSLRQATFAAVLTSGPGAFACSCFGPDTFCGTLDPPFPQPEWWIPDAVVLGIKLGDVQHGMDVRIVQAFSGPLQTDDTVRVWGDCGALCRHYVGSWNVGDTVVWSLRITDLSGNVICMTNYEQPTDYMISVCGVYYLGYSNGIITGPITTTANESLPIGQFGALVTGCLSTGIGEIAAELPLVVRYEGEVPVVEIPGGAVVDFRLIDAQGRVVISRGWNGSPMALSGPAPGAYSVEVRREGLRRTERVLLR